MLSMITGDEAKRAREALGASQTAVAAAIGVNRTYYSLFEAGRYILDDDEQQRLRSFLGDGRPSQEELSEPDHTDDAILTRAADEQPSALATSQASAPSDRETSVAALAQLKAAAAEPHGLRSKRTASAVGAALSTLLPLEYPELLAIAESRQVKTNGLPTVEAFEELGLDLMTVLESRAAAMLICDALYSSRWQRLTFDELKETESALHRTLGPGVVAYEGISLFSLIWDGDEHRASRRRTELAPFVVQAAQKRGAPVIAERTSVPGAAA